MVTRGTTATTPGASVGDALPPRSSVTVLPSYALDRRHDGAGPVGMATVLPRYRASAGTTSLPTPSPGKRRNAVPHELLRAGRILPRSGPLGWTSFRA